MEENRNQGNALDKYCEYCGQPQCETISREERAENFQILVACAQCGNEFAAISRN